jgi:hypothetical protein
MDSWRTALSKHLGEHGGKMLKVGELFDKFCNAIPLHDATRMWHKKHEELVTNEEMRWHLFQRQLRGLNLSFEPQKRLPFNRDTVVVVQQTTCCQACNSMFVGEPWKKVCNRACWYERKNLRQQQQVCVNVHPEDWEKFKQQSEMLGVSNSDRLGTLITKDLRRATKKLRLMKKAINGHGE